MLNGLGIATPTRGHSHLPTRAYQFFTYMAADKAGTAQHNDFFHGAMMRESAYPVHVAGYPALHHHRLDL